MPTPKFDRLCVEFLKRIPDQFRTAFTPGGGALPDGNMIKATAIIDYINRALQQLFNEYWKTAGGDSQTFISIFPELVKFSDAVALSSGNYTIASPHKDFFKIIGAIKAANSKYIKVKHEYKYTLYLSQEYDTEYKPTSDDPAIIQVNQRLAVFPQTLSGSIEFHYIAIPNDPTTGGYLTQNGSYDSPFFDHWQAAIVDLAYLKYLEETNQTT